MFVYNISNELNTAKYIIQGGLFSLGIAILGLAPYNCSLSNLTVGLPYLQIITGLYMTYFRSTCQSSCALAETQIAQVSKINIINTTHLSTSQLGFS